MFQISNKDDTETVARFRETCRRIIVMVHELKEPWLEAAEADGRLSGLDHADRLASFAMVVVAGQCLGRAGILPNGAPDTFLLQLAADKRKAPSGFFASAGMIEAHEEKEKAYGMVEGTIGSIPGFSYAALRKGEIQSAEFMAAFDVDFVAMRKIAFEIGRATGMLIAEHNAGNPEIMSLGQVYFSFEKSVLHGLHPESVEALLDRHFEGENCHEMEPG